MSAKTVGTDKVYGLKSELYHEPSVLREFHRGVPAGVARREIATNNGDNKKEESNGELMSMLHLTRLIS